MYNMYGSWSGKIDGRFHPYDPIAYRVEVRPYPEVKLTVAIDIEENGGSQTSSITIH
jgi:hypothetical protein